MDRWTVREHPRCQLFWGKIHRGIPHHCQFCGIPLLTGEKPGFCCGPRGSHLADVQPLPPLPFEYELFMNDKNISSLSRILNLLFSFAALETTHEFPRNFGPPGFLAIQGKVYHRIRPGHQDSAVRWLLYDGWMSETPRAQLAAQIPDLWVRQLRSALYRVNPLVQGFHSLGWHLQNNEDVSLILHDRGDVPEVAACISYENTTTNQVAPRQLVVAPRSTRIQHIPSSSRLWEPLVYPLLFPHGTAGWGVQGIHVDDDGMANDFSEGAASTQMWYYRARLLREPRFQIFGRLGNEYLVDMFSRDLESRLAYIRKNQQRLRSEDESLADVEGNDTVNTYLPASFLGSRRWAAEQIADSLAIAAALGNPSLFVTMTCNPDWPEITCQLRPGQNFTDIPIVVVRVFRAKLAVLERTLKDMFTCAGKQVYSIRSVEFQKRGLPHAHILVKFEAPLCTPKDIDSVVSAEMPHDIEDARLVTKFMLHKHPASSAPPSKYCQRDDAMGRRTCRFGFPHKLQSETTIDAEGRVHYRRRSPGDEMVVPHSLPLLRQFHCHINVEVANTSHIFQYLFKYILKGASDGFPFFGMSLLNCLGIGSDYTRYRVRANQTGSTEVIDEIDEYWNARYLSAGEAAWRIMGFNTTKKYPAVTSLPVHLPDTDRHRQYSRNHGTENTLSLLQRYFLRPLGHYMFRDTCCSFDDLTYTDYFSLFRLVKFDPAKSTRDDYFCENIRLHVDARMHVILRLSTNTHLSRMRNVRPSEGETFYLRTLLRHRPARSFRDLRTIDGVEYSTFQEATGVMGLFASQLEGEYALQEAVQSLYTPHSLRRLFVHLLVNDCLPTPLDVWNRFTQQLSFDYTLRHSHNPLLGVNKTLQELSTALEEYGRRPRDYGLPEPNFRVHEVQHELERWSSNLPLLTDRAHEAVGLLNAEQLQIYEEVMSAIQEDRPLLAFVDGQAGRGKTFLVNVICDRVRSMNQIALPTATSAFAAQLYPGGRTTHSALKVCPSCVYLP
jgi:hypothetical protein